MSDGRIRGIGVFSDICIGRDCIWGLNPVFAASGKSTSSESCLISSEVVLMSNLLWNLSSVFLSIDPINSIDSKECW
jgi:hypothetical protein